MGGHRRPLAKRVLESRGADVRLRFFLQPVRGSQSALIGNVEQAALRSARPPHDFFFISCGDGSGGEAW